MQQKRFNILPEATINLDASSPLVFVNYLSPSLIFAWVFANSKGDENNELIPNCFFPETDRDFVGVSGDSGQGSEWP